MSMIQATPPFRSLAVRTAGIACLLSTLLPLASARDITPLSGDWSYRFMDEAPTVVTLPHSWNAADAANEVKGKKEDAKSVNSPLYKRGAATYSRTLTLVPVAGKRYFLRGGGASIVSEVSVNGKPAGRHEGAFTAFCYEITPLLQEGENSISLVADNTHRDHIAPQRGDFSMFGGLYRPLELMETGQTCIDPLFHASPGVFITTQELTAQKATVEVKTLLCTTNPAGEKVALTVSICDAEGNEVASASKEVEVKGESPRTELPLQLEIAQPTLWDGVANPYLYSVRVSMSTANGQTDEVIQPLGLRRVSIDPERGFILNGRELQLRGVSRHQDKEGKGWALTPADEEQDIRLITTMGATALRTAHYPQSTHIYDLCNKAGLIVWSEVPNVNLVRDSEAFRANNRQQAMEMIYQNWNHPCICMWGIYNEIYHQPEPVQRQVNQEAELTALNQFVKQTDPHRMTVAASNQPGRQKLNTIPDHIAFNTYPGWYGGGPETMKSNLAGFVRNHPGKGVGVSEYGHGASVRMHESPAARPKPTAYWHPEEWQSHAHEVNYEHIRARRDIWGAFVWNMFDFGSSNRYEGECPGINDKGLVTYDRQVCKDAYFFYKANWNPEPMVYITSRRFAKRSQAEVEVKVYSNAESVSLSVNGVSCGSARPDELRRAVWPAVQLRPGENTITATALINGSPCTDSCVWTLEEGSAPQQERYQSPELIPYK